MIVSTPAKLRNLDQGDARKVALFVRTATTEGQKPGAGNGELPGGYLPIKKTGPTRKLYDVAQDVADAVEAQTPLPTEEPSPTATADPTLPSSGSDTPRDAPGGDVPSDVPSAAPSPSVSPTGPPAPIDMPPTEAVSSDLGNRAVPGLLIIGVIGLVVTSAARFLVRPERGPLR